MKGRGIIIIHAEGVNVGSGNEALMPGLATGWV